MHWCSLRPMRRCQRSKTGYKKRYFGFRFSLWGETQCIFWKSFGQHRAVCFWQREQPGRGSIFQETVFCCLSSRACRLRIRNGMESGKVHFQNVMGYRKGPDGQPEIVPEEAKIVRKIYQRYLDGCSLPQIKQDRSSKIMGNCPCTMWRTTTRRSSCERSLLRCRKR